MKLVGSQRYPKEFLKNRLSYFFHTCYPADSSVVHTPENLSKPVEETPRKSFKTTRIVSTQEDGDETLAEQGEFCTAIWIKMRINVGA